MCHEWIVVAQETRKQSPGNRGFLLGEGFTKSFARRPPEGLRGRVDCTARTDGAHPTESHRHPEHRSRAPAAPFFCPEFGAQHLMRIVAGGFADYS